MNTVRECLDFFLWDSLDAFCDSIEDSLERFSDSLLSPFDALDVSFRCSLGSSGDGGVI